MVQVDVTTSLFGLSHVCVVAGPVTQVLLMQFLCSLIGSVKEQDVSPVYILQALHHMNTFCFAGNKMLDAGGLHNTFLFTGVAEVWTSSGHQQGNTSVLN